MGQVHGEKLQDCHKTLQWQWSKHELKVKWREKCCKETKKKSFKVDLKNNSSALFNETTV